MFLQFWFPFVPEVVELFQNIEHFLVDHLFVSLLLFNPNFFFWKISESAIVEFFEYLHMTFSKLRIKMLWNVLFKKQKIVTYPVQVFFKFSTLGSSSFIQTLFVFNNLCFFWSDAFVKLFLDFTNESDWLSFPGVNFFGNSTLNTFNLSKKVFFLSLNPDISLFLKSLTETIDFFLSWLNSRVFKGKSLTIISLLFCHLPAVGHWKHFWNLFFKTCTSLRFPISNLFVPFCNLCSKFSSVFFSRLFDCIDVRLFIKWLTFFSCKNNKNLFY